MKRKIWTALILVVLTLVMLPTSVFAAGGRASYSALKSKFWGYSTSVSVVSNYKISTSTVSELVNKKAYAVKTSDTISVARDITYSYGCSSKISSSISAKDGGVSGSLGAELENSYSFSSNYNRTYTKNIEVTVPAKTTYKLNATIVGDKVSICFKHFIVFIESLQGSGTVYVPRYCSWTCD